MPNAAVREILATIGDGDAATTTIAERLCRLATARLDIEGAGLSLISVEGGHGIVAATGGPAYEMEELQFATGEGPCVDASRSGRPVLQPDLMATGTQRWPGFGPAALGLGMRAVFAFPLQIGAVRIGALDLYRASAGRLTAAELAQALSFADAAMMLLLHMQERTHTGAVSEALLGDLDLRAEVHQATGMISAQLDVRIGEALLRLRAHAYAEGRSVSALASDVVSRRLRFVVDDNGDATTDWS